MKQLIYKELKLCLHPASVMFFALSALVIIPNYPYYVTFFYTCLGIFFICLQGRENHDIFYTMSLPVRKEDIVSARVMLILIMQLVQMLCTIPCAYVRQLNHMKNASGIEANVAFFGLSFFMLGLFNFVFIRRYFAEPDKVGKDFAFACTALGVFVGVAEACVHAVPFMKTKIDTMDPDFMTYKLIFLGVGILAFIVLTFVAYKRGKKSFEALDL